MNQKKILGFDTSGLNAMTNDRHSTGLIAGIRVGYRIRLSAMSIDEIIGTQDEEARNRLLDICQRLLPAGDCMQPSHWIAERLIENFERHGHSGWQTLDLRALDYENEICRREIVNNALAREQHDFSTSAEKRFADLFGHARPEFDKVFANGTQRPVTSSQLLSVLQVPGGAFWTIGAALYEHVAKHQPGEDNVRAFLADCPPFNALLLSLVMAQFERTTRDLKSGESYRAGRADLFTSVYLPYVDVFITNDERQRRCLREIAVVAHFGVEILSYEDFRNGHFLQLAANATQPFV